MNLINLVFFFRAGYSIDDFHQMNNLNKESEVIEIYMQKPFGIENELSFFEFEKAEGKIEYSSNGIVYHNLLDMHYFMDMVSEFLKTSLTDEDIALRTLNYAINDA